MTQRIFQHQRLWRLEAADADQAAHLIAQHEHATRPNLVIGIARGGVAAALAVAADLAAPAVMVSAQHNPTDQIALAATGTITLDLSSLAGRERGGRVLLVDDICGSGTTLRAATRAITALLAPRLLRTAVLCRNAGADFQPDLWVWDVADWVCFPWEPPPPTPTQPLPTPTTVRCMTPCP